jgi:hypothetical protein
MLSILAGAAMIMMADCPPRQRRGCTEGNAAASGVFLSTDDQSDPSADSIYWQPPTRVTTSLDGNVLITVGRLANMARMPSLFDQGWLMHFSVHIDFYGETNCSGPVIHANNYPVASLNYKEDRSNVSTTVYDSRIRELGGAIRCFRPQYMWSGE